MERIRDSVERKDYKMSEKFEGLSENAKMIAFSIGYVGACVGICYVMYKWLAAMVGKAVVAELIKDGIVTVL